MRFACYKNDLTEALAFVIKAAAVKPQTPVLSGIYLRAADGMLELQANNNTTGISAKIPVSVEEPGETVVSGKRLVEFARNLPDDTITFFTDGNALAMESGGAHVELLTMEPLDFPKVAPEPPTQSFKIKLAILADLVRRTVFAVAKDDSRPAFTGVQFIMRGDDITAIATNTHRLALAKDKLEEDCGDILQFIVRGDTLRDLLTRLVNKEPTEYVTINYNDGKSVAFVFENVLMTSRLIEGLFPPVDRIIPAESATHIICHTAELRKAIGLIALMAKETEFNTVKLDISHDALELSANSSHIGGATQPVEISFDGDPLTISFNVDYITDVLRAVTADKLEFAFNDRYSPAKVTEVGNDDYIYIVTPVRT